MSDGEVVKRLNVPGLNRDRVAQRRRRLGPAQRAPAPFKAPPDDCALIAIDAAKIRARREALGLSRFALTGHNRALAAHLGVLENGTQRAVKSETLKSCASCSNANPPIFTLSERL